MISSPVQNWKSVDFNAIPAQERYKIIIGAIVPRPIALISTIGPDGSGNLAPFSFFNGVSSNPACLVVSIASKVDTSGGKKDTLHNIERTGEFVVNSVTSWMLDQAVHSAASYPYGIDEMLKAGLTPIASLKVKAPRVRESAVQFECTLHKLVEIGDGSPGSSTLVIGQIQMAHIAEQAITPDGRVDLTSLQPIGRLGGVSYAELGAILNRPVPKV